METEFLSIQTPDAIIEDVKICIEVCKYLNDSDKTIKHYKKALKCAQKARKYGSGLGKTSSSEDAETLEPSVMLTEFELGQNFPNPFNPSTTITFAVPEAGEVKLTIYNLRGQLVQTLYSGPIAAGRQSSQWNLCVPPGSQ